jgi:hypothetical protein
VIPAAQTAASAVVRRAARLATADISWYLFARPHRISRASDCIIHSLLLFLALQRRSPFGDADSYCDCGAGGYKKRPCKSLRQFDCDKAKAGAAASAPSAAAASTATSAAGAGTGLSEATLALGNLKL